ncbi:MAG: dihydropteroate synthase [Desulfobacteraceae bacterium]|jgi:dihydropteroate synthase|nr:dihydropteroate synthase [Desulfobacteraceae bacterium]
MAARKAYRLAWSGRTLELGKRTCIMGVVNVTPDSFSDGGKFFDTGVAIARGEKLAADGADILDVGGESTRPFSDPVPVEEEIRRVVPVIEKLAQRVSIPISIDTTKADVARRALAAGASIINDVAALRFDPGLAALAAEFDTALILMHMLGEPKSMQVDPRYDNLIEDICSFLEDAVARAEKLGVSRSKIIVDPGIGFGKTITHNLLLLKHVEAFASLDLPVLLGPSRKAFIRKILKQAHEEDIRPDLPIVETGTQAAVAAAVLNGAHILRVHDVANTVATVKILDALREAHE